MGGMLQVIKYFFRLGALALVTASAMAAPSAKETLIFLQEDGRSYITYNTARTSASAYSLYLDKDASLERYWYINPNDFRWDESGAELNALRFPEGEYATLFSSRFETEVQVDETGIYHFRSWDGSVREDGHFGMWTSPQNFGQFVYVWIFPKNFEVISYRSNRAGEWVQRHNTLAYYGKEVNDLAFEIDYRLRSQEAYEQLQASLAGESDTTGAITVEQRQHGVTVTLAETLLFPPGSSELSERGKRVLTRLAGRLQRLPELDIVVGGHSDSSPIGGRLQREYATNWELSAARSLVVVRHLQQAGIEGERLEGRAYGEFRPIASNETAEGRAQNRRIEIELFETEH